MGVFLSLDVLNKGVYSNVSTICKKWLPVNWTKKLQAVFVNPGSHAILRVKLHALNCMANCMQFNAYNWP
jgi:hypothetical protein